MGGVISLFGIMTRFSIGGYPLGDTLALTLHDLIAWIISGLLISWIIKPVVKASVTNTD
jgi:hypothetical protein